MAKFIAKLTKSRTITIPLNVVQALGLSPYDLLDVTIKKVGSKNDSKKEKEAD